MTLRYFPLDVVSPERLSGSFLGTRLLVRLSVSLILSNISGDSFRGGGDVETLMPHTKLSHQHSLALLDSLVDDNLGNSLVSS